MNPSRWRDVNSSSTPCSSAPPAERERLLADDRRRDDPELAREVRSLLREPRARRRLPRRAGLGRRAGAARWTTPTPLIGRQIGAYRIVEEIGRGGMGVVYAAEDERLGRMVALKALPPEFTRDPARRARLTREARAAAALSHPAIATIYALEETGDGLYIVERAGARADAARGAARRPARRRRGSFRRSSTSPARSTPRTRSASSIAISSRRT